MERINLKTMKVSHFDILRRIENRCYDRQAYHSATISDLRQLISQHETQLQNEADNLKACQAEMAQIEAETVAIEQAGSHFETVELVRTDEGHEYYVLQYETDKLFSYGYIRGGTFLVCPREFDSQDEAFKAIEKRELSLYLNETVMF
jgi:hypothetical protein